MSRFTKILSWLPWNMGEAVAASNDAQPPRIVVTAECLNAIVTGIESERLKRHEAIVYLLGLATDSTTLLVGAVRPNAATTSGSFEVSARSMAKVVRTACAVDLHIVGQLHTHPGTAYHSEGDERGARIRFPGFASIVLPSYGDRLPDFSGAAVFLVGANGSFRDVPASDVRVLPRGALWPA